MRATMGENCHNDRGGAREIKRKLKGAKKEVDEDEMRGERELWWRRKAGQAKEGEMERGKDESRQKTGAREGVMGELVSYRLSASRVCLPAPMNF